MKIEDGFEDIRPNPAVQTSVQQTRQTGSVSGGMIFAAVGIAVFTGFLGFLGGMQINKSSSMSTNGMTPPSLSSGQRGDMMPPDGQAQGAMGTSTSASSLPN